MSLFCLNEIVALKWIYTSNGDVESVAISSDGEYVSFVKENQGNSPNKLFFFDKDNNTPLWDVKIGSSPTLSISANGKYIAQGDAGGHHSRLFKNDLATEPFVLSYSPSGSTEVTPKLMACSF